MKKDKITLRVELQENYLIYSISNSLLAEKNNRNKNRQADMHIKSIGIINNRPIYSLLRCYEQMQKAIITCTTMVLQGIMTEIMTLDDRKYYK